MKFVMNFKNVVFFNQVKNGLLFTVVARSLLYFVLPLLLQIFVKYQNQGQFQNLRILKLSLEVKFHQDLAEKIKVKDNRLIPK